MLAVLCCLCSVHINEKYDTERFCRTKIPSVFLFTIQFNSKYKIENIFQSSALKTC